MSTVLASPMSSRSAMRPASPSTQSALSRSSSAASITAVAPGSPREFNAALQVTPAAPDAVLRPSRKRPTSDITPPMCATAESLQELEKRLTTDLEAARKWYDAIYQHVRTVETDLKTTFAKREGDLIRFIAEQTTLMIDLKAELGSRLTSAERRLTLLEQTSVSPVQATPNSESMPVTAANRGPSNAKTIEQRISDLEYQNYLFINAEVPMPPPPLPRAPMPTRWDYPVSPQFL